MVVPTGIKQKTRAIVKALPEYMDPPEIEALIEFAPKVEARLLILVQWRGGLRVSEALNVRFSDFQMDGDNPTLRVRQGKGKKARLVPIHSELAAAANNYLLYQKGVRPDSKVFSVTRVTAWNWVQSAKVRAVASGRLPDGRNIGTHTLRHSAARHWLGPGHVPINVVSRWLGHASIQQTLIYLEILPDPTGYMDRVP